MKHKLEGIVPRPGNKVTWSCSCGETGIPVGDIVGALGQDRAKRSHEIHVDLENDEERKKYG